MSQKPPYKEYHPRWYRPRISTYWWLQRWSYLAFILRELSSVFFAWFVIYLLMLVHAINQGRAAYYQFLGWSTSRGLLLLNLVALFFIIFHTITWFNLAPQAMVLRMRGKRVPGTWIAASNYGAWVVVSGLLLWLVLGG
jgi:fumarate reductase subunit C